MRKLGNMLACSVLVMAGCSQSEHAQVSGVVKINGQPVEGATIMFSPQEGGRSAFAQTGPDGSYELIYGANAKGAKIGVNEVSITTYAEAEVDDDEKVVVPEKPERFPPEYQSGSITSEVKPGKNTIDFDVEAAEESYPQLDDET